MKKGFTLVEILVVIAIVAIMGIILVAIFTNTLRGSNKAQVLAVIKQNGQAVLEDMDKTIRGADNVLCPDIIPPTTSTTSTNLVVVSVSTGVYTRYRFINSTSNTNGLLQQDKPSKKKDDSTGSEETDGAFRNRVCNLNDPMAQLTVLTDTNAQSGVSVTNGSFTRSKQPGSEDSVTVKFDLDHGVGVPAALAGQIDPVTFQTTIQLR